MVYSRSKMAVDKLNFEFENNDCTIIVDGICTDRSVRYNIDGKREKQIRKKSKIVNVICLLVILLFIFIIF